MGHEGLPISKFSEVIMERLLNPHQLAEILDVKVGTVYSWLSRGVDVPHVKIAGTVRFREKAVIDWIMEKERERKRRNFEL
jgi:phage terminase Nu1 subunit (DNA packaging protein)